jgi:HK97 gp10 family phage protein
VSDFTLRLDRGALDRLLESPQGPVGRHLARVAVAVDRMAKSLCPVDTGLLRASINWRLGSDGRGLLAIIGTSTHYAPYIEFGTRYMAAQPFLRPALAAAR